MVICFLRGHPLARRLFERLVDDEGSEMWICANQRAEIVMHMKPAEEAATLDLLSLFHTEPVTAAVVDLGVAFYRQWRSSHGIDFNDALLAATAVLTGGTVITLNTRHYPMPGLKVERAWEVDSDVPPAARR